MTAEAPHGLQAWTNPHNRFRVLSVHYTADPDKRSAEWKRAASAGMPPRGWLREYEINFAIPEGKPVFPEFVAGEMVREIRVLPGGRLLRFWDFGFVSPVCLYAQLDPWGRLLVHQETVLEGAGIDMLIDAVLGTSADLMGGPCPVWDAGDPAGESMTDLGQVRQQLLKHGILLNAIRSRLGSYDALRARLLGRTVVSEQPSPMLLVHPRCTTLIRAASGAFYYLPSGKVCEAHPWKDVMDALRYGNDNLLGTKDGHLEAMRKAAAIDRAW